MLSVLYIGKLLSKYSRNTLCTSISYKLQGNINENEEKHFYLSSKRILPQVASLLFLVAVYLCKEAICVVHTNVTFCEYKKSDYNMRCGRIKSI